MADRNNDATTRKIRVVLGPSASRLLEDIPQADRVTALDEFIEKAQQPRQPEGGPVDEHAPSLNRRLELLTDAIVELHAIQDDMITTQQSGLDLILEEIKNTRALIGSELTEEDDRQALISRMHEVTEQREAAAAHLISELGLTLATRRRGLEEGMLHLEPVVRDARDPEQDTELQQQDRGGRER